MFRVDLKYMYLISNYHFTIFRAFVDNIIRKNFPFQTLHQEQYGQTKAIKLSSLVNSSMIYLNEVSMSCGLLTSMAGKDKQHTQWCGSVEIIG